MREPARPPRPLAPDALPHIRTAVPGPRSRELAGRLGAVESRNVTRLLPDPPIFWEEASGAAVRDADGNTFVDLTAGFGVAAAGHAHPAVTAAIARQAARLPHALGDVHPASPKVELLERLAALAPGRLSSGILGSAGAEGVEAALKTALLRTGRAGVLAFEGSYHGLTAGALAVTHRADFRAPFLAQLNPHVRFAPYPASIAELDHALLELERALSEADGSAAPIGAIIVEPVLGRGGLVVPPAAFLPRLRQLCDGERRVLIFDEVYTGFGRTGAWFACQHAGVDPDIIVLGKALTGSIALSAALGTPEIMDAWPPSTGEAIHTSTFLGNPVACAAALAQLTAIEEQGLVERAATLGARIARRLDGWAARFAAVRERRGIGLLQGVVLGDPAGRPAGGLASDICRVALRHGVIVLAEGAAGDVLAITPPAVITDAQLDAALAVLETALAEAAG